MDKDSLYELQKIDCNCNDCKFMVRDLERFAQSLKFHEELQLKEFNRKRDALNKIVNDYYRENELEKGYQNEQELNKMKFQFDKKKAMINYGKCTKLNKPVSFIPSYMSTDDTAKCFVHRRDA